MNTAFVIKLIASGVAAAFAFIMLAVNRTRTDGEKKAKRRKTLFTCLLVFSVWFFVATMLTLPAGAGKGISGLKVEMFSPRVTVFGISFAQTGLLASAVVGILLILALLFRFLAVPRFSEEKPGKLQTLMEVAVETVDKFVSDTTHGADTGALSSYMFSVAFFLVGCAATELFGLRAPTSDLVVTFSLGLVTFFLIRFYGYKKKRFRGRMKQLASPTPIMFPLNLISGISVPVSLACRLFGNMLGGMVVMELLNSALGCYHLGVSSVAGIYFNLFHPLIQTYIFITLSLTFINEAIEPTEES